MPWARAARTRSSMVASGPSSDGRGRSVMADKSPRQPLGWPPRAAGLPAVLTDPPESIHYELSGGHGWVVVIGAVAGRRRSLLRVGCGLGVWPAWRGSGRVPGPAA